MFLVDWLTSIIAIPSKFPNVCDFGMKMCTSQPPTAQLFFQEELWLAERCTFSCQNRTRLGALTVSISSIFAGHISGFAYDFVDNFLIIVGGRSCGNRHNDVYCFNVITSTWKCLSEGCAPDTRCLLNFDCYTVNKVQIHVITILILTSSSWHYHFGGTGLHIDRDTTVRDDKGNEHPEPRSLHSMTRYLGSFAKYIFRFCTH